MAIRVKSAHIEKIKEHAERAYPQECCGFLIGRREAHLNVLEEVYPAENEWSDLRNQQSKQNRYLITPDQYKRADQYARSRGLGIIGYYHSHPDHPAFPSGFDLDHSCWPGESYIIVSVEGGRPTALNSFTKPDYARFEQEEIILED